MSSDQGPANGEAACGWPERCDWRPPSTALSSWEKASIDDAAWHMMHKDALLKALLIDLATRAVIALEKLAEA